MSRIQQERLKVDIDALASDQLPHEEIYTILLKHNVPCTTMHEGVLVVADDIPPAAFEEVKAYVQFCSDQKPNFHSREGVTKTK